MNNNSNLQYQKLMLMFHAFMLLGSELPSYEDIYNRYFKVVYGVVKRYHPENAEDITADIFVKKIWRAVNRGLFQRPGLGDKGLVITTAKNYCITIYNRNKARRMVPIEVEDDDTTPVSLDNPSLSVELSIDLAKAFSILSEPQRTVMYLTIEGYTDKEIGEIMEKTIGAVRQLRSRARTRIKQFFKD